MEGNGNLLFAFLITLFAGLSTGIGGALGVFTKKTNTKFLSFALGLSAGVMIYVSFVELFPQARNLMAETVSKQVDLFITLAFFAGIAVIFIIDMLIPDDDNPHEIHKVEDIERNRYSELKRIGIMTALAIAIHNFPEGIATFATAIVSPELAIPIAVAIAIHNIPEGIAVSIPIYYSTGNRHKAFWLSLSSGMAEPIGGLIGFLILKQFLDSFVLGVIMAGIAGIMVYISVDELLPSAEKYGEHHFSVYGFIVGMAIMAGSLLIL